MSKSTETPATGSLTFLRWFRALVVIVAVVSIGRFVYFNATSEEATHPFKLGLDLAGGSHLVYEADTSKLESGDVPELMNVLREVIERRVNAFGVSEPVVQVERSSFVSDVVSERLVVELPGVTDVNEAVKQIGKTPLLEFKLYNTEYESEQESLEGLKSLSGSSTAAATALLEQLKVEGKLATLGEQEPFLDTGLTGLYLKTAQLGFASGQINQVNNDPLVEIQFNEQGAELFAQITKEHVGEQLGIFLDGELLSAPVINEQIVGGKAVISGDFTADEAKELARNLSFGALPMPIKLSSTQTIDATLGSGVVKQSIFAGVMGFALISLFMILWYRLPGLVACFALASYMLISLLVFQLIPVTLTAAGLAGLVLSLGIAVDANVLVFERMKEEFRSGKSSREATIEGFSRAWSAIRDSNITGLLSGIILFWFGTAMIKGFALVLSVGIIISMISAITLTRTLLMVLPDVKRTDKGILPYLFGSGLTKK